MSLCQQIRAAVLGPPVLEAPEGGEFLRTFEGIWRLDYRLPSDFLAFQGHFEGRPILPALAQVLLAKDGATVISRQSVFIEQLPQAKFLSLVEPEAVVTLFVRPPQSSYSGEWRFQMMTEAVVVSLIRLFLRCNDV